MFCLLVTAYFPDGLGGRNVLRPYDWDGNDADGCIIIAKSFG